MDANVDETLVRETLKAFICRDVLRNPTYPLQHGESLIVGGLIDSLALAQIGAFVEAEFGVYIPDTDLTVEAMDTLDAMVARILAG